MKLKYIFSFLLLLLMHLSLNAQTALAKLKFEDAEIAYNNQDYVKATQKLDEAEKLFGKSNPPILHLRILILDKQVQKETDWPSLDKLMTSCLSFLKDYENVEALEEKYRDVYKIYAAVTDKYGSNEEEYKAYLKKQKDKQIAIEESEKNRPAKVYVFRQTGIGGVLSPFGVFLNKTLVCKLNNGNHTVLQLNKGEHQIRIRGFMKNNKFEKVLEKNAGEFPISVEAGKIYFYAIRYNAWNGKFGFELLTEEAGKKSLRETSQANCNL
ncbi:MAG TPA: hypothetical protein PLJ41_13365 [Sediminibacterium sp.]|jgi:uncharacterized protein YutD|uniref:hypothetical protein n=1 Tax=Sediminibacterium sp. TaxID=1917865 RepID=UPI0026904273|nr:hypothetical protein [Sediminibacterium sp.]HQS25426.1 hypothetical protein [Sediminibacterium sp.]